MSRSIIKTLLFLGILLSPTLLQAFQPESVYPISKIEDEYSGEGVEWILDQREQTQFLLFGEQHGVDGIPEFVEFIYSSISDSGFWHLALESDRWTTHRTEEMGVKDFIQKYPHSIAFDYDADLKLMETAIREYGSHSEPILWGMDQMITAIHPLQRLAEIAPNSKASRLSRGAYLKATLKMGEYLREDHFRDFDAIEQAFGENISDEASLILTDLRTSMDIYTKWRAGERGEISRIESPEIRENMMKNRLDDYLSENRTFSKAVFKMGGAHTMYGVGPNEVETLGEHARKLAESNGLKSISIGIRSYNSGSGFLKEDFFRESDIILIDVEEYLQIHQADTSLPALSQFDGQFDALIYLNDAGRASKSTIAKVEKQFERLFLLKIAVVGFLGLILLSSIFPTSWLVFKSKSDHGKEPTYPFIITSFAGLAFVGLFGIQLYGFFNYPDMLTTITGFGFWFSISVILAAIYTLFLTYSAWQQEWWGKGKRVYFSVLTSSFTAFSGFIWYWNIGGMLGN